MIESATGSNVLIVFTELGRRAERDFFLCKIIIEKELNCKKTFQMREIHRGNLAGCKGGLQLVERVQKFRANFIRWGKEIKYQPFAGTESSRKYKDSL